jgi:hypothetical protein
VPLSTGDLKNHTSKIIPEIDIKCSIAGELVPCLIAVPTYENDTCFNALLKVSNCLISLGSCTSHYRSLLISIFSFLLHNGDNVVDYSSISGINTGGGHPGISPPDWHFLPPPLKIAKYYTNTYYCRV